MSCPPNPGIIEYLACIFGLLASHPAQLAALCASALALISALALARVRADHRPIALALAAVFMADLMGTVIAPALGAGPYHGWARVLFHLDEARFLVWPAALIWVSRSVYGVGRPWLSAAFWAFCVAVGVLAYPWLRSDALAVFYAGAQATAIVFAIAATSSARRITVAPCRVIVALMIALDVLAMCGGSWTRGLFGDAYVAEQWILVVMYGSIALYQAHQVYRVSRHSRNRVA